MIRRIFAHIRNLDAEDYVILILTALALFALYWATEYALTVTIG